MRSESYFVRQYKTELFISKTPTADSRATLSSFDTAGMFEVGKAPSSYTENEVKVLESSNMVWDIAQSKKDLIFFRYHGGSNQRFTLIPVNCEGVFNIGWGRRCVTYSTDKKILELKACNATSTEQQFEFLNVEKFAAHIASGGSPGGSGGGAMAGYEPGAASGNGSGAGSASPDLTMVMYGMLKEIYRMMIGRQNYLPGFGINLEGSFIPTSRLNHSQALSLKGMDAAKIQDTLARVSMLCNAV